MEAIFKTKEKTKSSYWQKHINCWHSSGLSQAQYCRKNMLALSTFTYWKSKLALEKSSPTFYPMTVQGDHQNEIERADSGLRLVVGERRFEIEIAREFTPATLVRLVNTLENFDANGK